MPQFIRAVVAALLLAAAIVVQAPSQVWAEETWCLNDPTLVVNGQVIHLNVGVPKDQLRLVNGVRLVVEVPANVPATLSGTQAAAGVGRLRIVTHLEQTGTSSGAGAVPVTVRATVDAPRGLPTRLTAWQAGVGDLDEVTGTRAGEELVLRLTVGR